MSRREQVRQLYARGHHAAARRASTPSMPVRYRVGRGLIKPSQRRRRPRVFIRLMQISVLVADVILLLLLLMMMRDADAVLVMTLAALSIIAAIGIVTALASMWMESRVFFRREWLAGWFGGISTEMVGAIVTAILLGVVIGIAQKTDEESNLRDRLMQQLGSSTNLIARQAVEELRLNGWLEDGSLAGLDLSFANLAEADFSEADLRRVYFSGANLQGANFRRADLQGAALFDADGRGAIFDLADLRGAIFYAVDLEAAQFWKADLRGADFAQANLLGADFTEATFDSETILPDETMWSAEADLRRFTDPAHPDYWRSDDPDSPAYLYQ